MNIGAGLGGRELGVQLRPGGLDIDDGPDDEYVEDNEENEGYGGYGGYGSAQTRCLIGGGGLWLLENDGTLHNGESAFNLRI